MNKYILITSLFISLKIIVFGQNEMIEKHQMCQHASHQLNNFKGRIHIIPPSMQNYNLTYMEMELETQTASTQISNTCIIYGQINDNIDSLPFHFNNAMTVNSVSLNNETAQWSFTDNIIFIKNGKTLAANSQFEVEINYQGDGNDPDGYSGGLHLKYVQGKPLLYSFTQPYGAATWFPCKQDNTDKYDSLKLSIITDKDLIAASNGLLAGKEPYGADKIKHTWVTHYPIAYYLIAINVYDYFEYTYTTQPVVGGPDVLIQNFMLSQSHSSEYKSLLDRTADIMFIYSRNFGLYPLYKEKYGHVIWGHGFGMEHQTLTSMPEGLDFRRMSHELSHQWFGNYVTCATWQDIWLNEGIASFLDYYALNELESEQSGTERMEYYHRRARENVKGSLYVPETDVNDPSRVFKYSLSYCKGAVVVDMLRYELQNDELLWEAMTYYLEQYAGKSATTEQFKNAISEYTKINLDYFFDQWVYGEGFPSYSGEWYQKGDSLFVIINQAVTAPSTTPFFEMHVPIRITTDAGIERFLFKNTEKGQKFGVKISGEVSHVRVDENDVILGEDGYFIENPTLGVQKIGDETLKTIYLPGEDKLIITNNSPWRPNQLKVVNLNGQVVKQQRFTGKTADVWVDHLPKGVYILIVQSSGPDWSTKLLIH